MSDTHVFSDSTQYMTDNPDARALKSLISKAKQGEAAAFGEIYGLYFQRIYKFIFYRVSHKEIAEDLAEEVFLKAYAKMASIIEEGAFEGWLYQIARNKVIDHYREKKITIALEDVEHILEYESNVIDTISLGQDQKIALELLPHLTKEQQSVIKLKFFENLENSEIAGMLKKTEGAIRVIQHRAIIRLQELIKGQGISNS